MPDEPDLINRQMEATRQSLCDKIETLEQKVVGTVTGAQAAVSDTVNTVKDSVRETVDTVKGTVRDTVEGVKDAFDVRQHVEKHPCLSMGGAVAVGFLLGRLTEGHHKATGFTGPRFGSFAESTNGHTFAKARNTPVDRETARGAEAPSGTGWMDTVRHQFGPEIDKIKAVAVGAGISLLRDLLTRSLPQQLKPHVTDVMNRVTTKLGGESMPEGVFSGTPDGNRAAGVV
jgi:ElaB/YqjD/DUF883 family membrane-anchored ribosome-binding protein